MFLDAYSDKTYVVRVMQHDERGAGSTTRRRACGLKRERVGRGRCRLHRVLKGEILGCELMVQSEPNAPMLLSDVGELISAHSSRKMAVQKGTRWVGRV